jgi:hypothetical protein
VALVDDETATRDVVCLERLYSAQRAGEFAELCEDLAALRDYPIANDQ